MDLLDKTSLGLDPVDVNDRGAVLGHTGLSFGNSAIAIWSDSEGVKKIAGVSEECDHGCQRGVAINNLNEVLIQGPAISGPGAIWLSRGLAEPSKLACGQAAGFNDSGQVVAQVCGTPNQFDYEPAVVSTVTGISSVAGPKELTLSAINNAGSVVGKQLFESLDTLSNNRDTWAAQLVNGMALSLGQQGFVRSEARAINSSGVVVGIVDTEHVELGQSASAVRRPRPSVWRSVGRTSLQCPDVDGEAMDINDSGAIVGQCNRLNGTSYAVLWREDGTPVNLNTLLKPAALSAGWSLTAGLKINNLGWIIARGTSQGGVSTGTVLLRP